MKRANKAKGQARNQKANKFSNNSSITIFPTREIEKPVPEVKKSLWSDEEYVAGFAENKKRVARTPPETLKKSVRNLDEDSNDGKKHKELKVNPHGESREEINQRQLAEVKECMNIEDPGETKENPDENKESESRIGEGPYETTSSSSKEESSSEEESISEEQEETAELAEKLNDMISTNSPDESVGLDLLRTLMKVPMTKHILLETDIANIVTRFRTICKTDEVSTLRIALFERGKNYCRKIQMQRRNTMTNLVFMVKICHVPKWNTKLLFRNEISPNRARGLVYWLSLILTCNQE